MAQNDDDDDDNHGATYSSFSSSSPIQRILILHLGLHETCMDGATLGERALLEEIAEQILYYHQEQRPSVPENADSEPRNKQMLMEEAVQFLGLCTALYSLPSSLAVTSACENETAAPFDETTKSSKTKSSTKAIYFEQSTLVFILLEESSSSTPSQPSTTTDNSILAVVQIARSRCSGDNSGNTTKSNARSGANPHAIQISIERCHRLFCMLNGGSIKQRLRQTHPLGKQNNDTSSISNDQNAHYWGMNDLFRLLKDVREQQERIWRSSSQSSDETYQIKKQIEDLRAQVRSLRRKLPIQAIRRDLDAHYREYLSNFSLIVSRSGGAGRCLVETLPIPIVQDSASHTLQLPPSLASSSTVRTLRQSLNQILKAHSPKNDDGLGLQAISTFHDGHLLHTVSLPNSHTTVGNESANLLMAYMASHKAKMTQHMAANNGLSIRSVAGALNNNDAADVHVQYTAHQDRKKLHRQGTFLNAPPSFMLRDGHECCSIEVSGEKKQIIWAPRVNLPATNSLTQDSVPSNMILFEFLPVSFLIFLNLDSNENRDAVQLLLMKLEEELTEAVLLSKNTDKEGRYAMDWTNSPGQEIVLLDRGQHSLILLQDPSSPLSRRDSKRKDLKQAHKQRRFLGFGPKKRDKSVLSSSRLLFAGSSSLAELSALGLDCRHVLSSRLPLDVCLAFDDMINDMAQRQDSLQPDTSVEICTCMSYGWMYAFWEGNKEVYAFFDNSIYVTVADVISAARRIQETFLVSSLNNDEE